GGYFIWVDRSWLNKLEALRQPGEDLSETIIRLVAMEAGGRPGRRGTELRGKDPSCSALRRPGRPCPALPAGRAPLPAAPPPAMAHVDRAAPTPIPIDANPP